MASSSYYQLHLDQQARTRYAVAEISQVAALLGISTAQLITLLDSGLRTSDLIEIVAKLALAVGSRAV